MTSISSFFSRSFQMPRTSPPAATGAASRQAPRNTRKPVVDHSRYVSRFEGSPHRSTRRAASRSSVPANLRAYGNGRIPSSKLESIGVGGHKLAGPAASAYKRMSADAAKAGVKIGVTDSYRSYAAQVDVARRKGLYKHGGLAATPGTSKHGWGLAVDVKVDRAGQNWLQKNASQYGFHTIPREPWHWEYRGQ